jgi:hypothetical protein
MTRTSTVTLVIAIFVSSMIFLSLAVSHAAEKAPDDDAFLLGCIWTGDHKRTVCGEFTTRASCEREGRAAVASGELSKFECISAVTIDWGALFDGVFRRILEEPTAAGPGGSDQPTFSKQMPVRTAASAPAPMAQSPPEPADASPRTSQDPGFAWRRKVAGPSAPDPGQYQRLLQSMGYGQQGPVMPNQHFMPAGTGPGWAHFMQNARSSTNIEDYRLTRGKPFIAQ